MHKNQGGFKRPPKRHQPKGLTVLYEDRDIVVVDKVCGLLTVSTAKVRENTAYYLLSDYVRKGNQKSKKRVFIVHRLDRETSGVIVFAKTENAKHFLQEEWHGFEKKYYAVVHGTMKEPKGLITSYLAQNSIHRISQVQPAGDRSADGKKEPDPGSPGGQGLSRGRRHEVRNQGQRNHATRPSRSLDLIRSAILQGKDESNNTYAPIFRIHHEQIITPRSKRRPPPSYSPSALNYPGAGKRTRTADLLITNPVLTR